MYLESNIRKFVILVALASMVIVGGLAGKQLAEWHQLASQYDELNNYTQYLLDRAEHVMSVSRDALSKASNSPYNLCSAEDMNFQRQILFDVPYIKDIGRIDEGKLACSTVLGQILFPQKRGKANIESADGTFAYSLGYLLSPKTKGVVVGKDGANLVLAAASFDRYATDKFQFMIELKSKNTNQRALLFQSGVGYPTNTEYDNRDLSPSQLKKFECVNQFGEIDICVSVQSTANRVAWYNQPNTMTAITAGMLLGSTVWLAVFFWIGRRQNLASRLRTAIAAKDLTMVYQPITSISDGRTVAFEALLRWEITKGNFVSPDVFIAKAEESGIIGRLTQYMIDLVIKEMGDYLVNNREFRININVTASDLENKDFINTLKEKLYRSNIHSCQIGIELTERAPINSQQSQDALHALSNEGHLIYIDDFGTGYSSISYLSRLKIDAIKIDKSFVRALLKEPSMPNIIPQMLTIAHKFKLSIVIEGIEFEEQAEYLKFLDSSLHGQGWFYGKPVSAELAMGNLTFNGDDVDFH